MKPDVVLIFAFGSKGTAPNARLSHKAKVFGKIGVPVFTQWDLPVGNGTVFYAEDVLRFLEDWRSEWGFSTLYIIRAFAYVVCRRGWKRVLILAAPQHERRCLRDAQKYLLLSNSGVDISSYHWALPWRWYDPSSAQRFTRGPIR